MIFGVVDRLVEPAAGCDEPAERLLDNVLGRPLVGLGERDLAFDDDPALRSLTDRRAPEGLDMVSSSAPAAVVGARVGDQTSERAMAPNAVTRGQSLGKRKTHDSRHRIQNHYKKVSRAPSHDPRRSMSKASSATAVNSLRGRADDAPEGTLVNTRERQTGAALLDGTQYQPP